MHMNTDTETSPETATIRPGWFGHRKSFSVTGCCLNIKSRVSVSGRACLKLPVIEKVSCERMGTRLVFPYTEMEVLAWYAFSFTIGNTFIGIIYCFCVSGSCRLLNL